SSLECSRARIESQFSLLLFGAVAFEAGALQDGKDIAGEVDGAWRRGRRLRSERETGDDAEQHDKQDQGSVFHHTHGSILTTWHSQHYMIRFRRQNNRPRGFFLRHDRREKTCQEMGLRSYP